MVENITNIIRFGLLIFLRQLLILIQLLLQPTHLPAIKLKILLVLRYLPLEHHGRVLIPSDDILILHLLQPLLQLLYLLLPYPQQKLRILNITDDFVKLTTAVTLWLLLLE